MRATDLIARYPLLYHMAEDGSWPSIRRHGLLSTRALLDLFDVGEPAREALLSRRRPESVQITHAAHGNAVVRDNKPLSDAKLSAALDGMTLPQWYRTLNDHVFFWVRQERLIGLLKARAYRERPHLALTLDTARFVAAFADRIRLSPINSGSTAYRAASRGIETFRTIEAYPYEERRRSRGRDAVVELAVISAVPDVMPFVVRVERWHGDQNLEVLWQG